MCSIQSTTGRKTIQTGSLSLDQMKKNLLELLVRRDAAFCLDKESNGTSAKEPLKQRWEYDAVEIVQIMHLNL